MNLEVAPAAAVVSAADLRVAGVADDLDPLGTARLVRQRVPMAGKGVGSAGQVQVEVAVVAAVARSPATTAAAIAGEGAALVPDQRARVAVVVDDCHDANSSSI